MINPLEDDDPVDVVTMTVVVSETETDYIYEYFMDVVESGPSLPELYALKRGLEEALTKLNEVIEEVESDPGEKD